MSRRTSNLEIYNLDDPTGLSDFELKRFPRQIDTHDRANYEQLDVVGFVKPLSYLNTDPQVIEFQEVWLDNTESGLSVLPEIERLRELTRRGANGAPPRLQLVIGDWEAVVVLVELRAERTRFSSDNVQTRARLSLTFWEVQGGERVSAAPGTRPDDARFSF